MQFDVAENCMQFDFSGSKEEAKTQAEEQEICRVINHAALYRNKYRLKDFFYLLGYVIMSTHLSKCD